MEIIGGRQLITVQPQMAVKTQLWWQYIKVGGQT